MNKTAARYIGVILIIWGLICLHGCVTTSRLTVRHSFPEENINYEISQEISKIY
tara:strand:+ start:556 stop:717 length:162 start_codon:yes stop_codon:yes gene_type:complete